MPDPPSIAFDPELVRRYDRAGPRYTSYPTAPQFSETFGPAEYREAAQVSNARGGPLSLYVHLPFCASPCFYCACTRVITRQRHVADAYLERLRQEVRMQGPLFDRSRGVQQLHLGGGTPTFLDIGQLGSLMAALASQFTLSGDATREYSIELDPRAVGPDMIAGLAFLGFNRVSVGVQDFDPAVQMAVNRVQSVEETAAVIEQARRFDFSSVSVDLIYGLPRQTPQGFARTLEQVIALRPDRVAAYSYAHMPHLFTAQRKIAPEELPDSPAKLALLQLTIQRLADAGYEYIGMDHFALPEDQLACARHDGTLHRNFQGYSTLAGCDLVGLGLSAISRIGDTYSQNAKTLDSYYRMLDAGLVPVQGGLQLNRDDLVRRAVIESLMCQGGVDFDAIGQRFAIDFRGDFANELASLKAMIDDGLLVASADGLRITTRGRFLLRPIAMAFDAYLGKGQPAGKARYSRVI